MNKLKFEGFKVGQTIKAFDFKPMKGRPDSFIIGEIVDINYGLYYAYVVRIIEDSDEDGFRIGKTCNVPFESTFDYDERVTLVEVEHEG